MEAVPVYQPSPRDSTQSEIEKSHKLSGQDGSTVGLLLCESHRSPIVDYTLRNIDKPMGVSSYRVTRELPAPIREEVPTAEDLQEMVTKLRGRIG
jgi:hypothetical protein